MLNIKTISPDEPLCIIIGAGQQTWPGWIVTQGDELNLLQRDQWNLTFRERRVDAFLCEHVWEHLTEHEGRTAAALCYDFLKPHGYIRCAVPDAYFRNAVYQQTVQVGGPGPADHPAADHKIVYDYKLFADIFTDTGFTIDLLEYCDESGRFHFNYWNPADGPIFRSLRSDPRNQDGTLGFVSLILDAIKR